MEAVSPAASGLGLRCWSTGTSCSTFACSRQSVTRRSSSRTPVRQAALIASSSTWVVEIPDEAERALTERYRSERMQQRGARTKDEEALLRDEAQRLADANRRLRDHLETPRCAGGGLYVDARTDPRPDDAAEPKAEARRVLGPALEAVFHRFAEGGVKVQGQDVVRRSPTRASLASRRVRLTLTWSRLPAVSPGW